MLASLTFWYFTKTIRFSLACKLEQNCLAVKFKYQTILPIDKMQDQGSLGYICGVGLNYQSKKMVHSRRRWFKFGTAVYAALFSFQTLAQSASVNTVLISRQDKLELAEFYGNMLRQKLKSELKLRGINDADASVSLSLQFDEKKAQADSDSWKRAQTDSVGKERQELDESFRKNVTDMLKTFNDEQAKKEEQTRQQYEERVKKIYDEYVKKINEDHNKRLSEEQAKKLAEDQAKRQKTAETAKTTDGPKEGVRLGRLNVDIVNSTISEIIAKAQEAQQTKLTEVAQAPTINVNTPAQPPFPPAMPAAPAPAPVTLAISVPSSPAPTTGSFVFKPADYITKVNVEVTLPPGSPKDFAEVLPSLVGEFLEFSTIAKGANTIDWVKVKVAPALPAPAPPAPVEAATAKTFFQSIWKPDNAFVSTVVSGLILGLFVFLAMLLASRALSKGIQTALSGLGKDIAALKPAEEGGDGGTEDATVEDSPASADQDEDQRGSFDQAAAGQALTREMQNIRVQMTALISENTFLCAEYLSDMFYDDNGLADFRDLLSFMGYAPLKPSLDQLPRAAVQKLESYIEEHRETPPNILNGAEIAQRMYGECISKATLRDDGMKAFDPVRAVLIKSDDAVIQKFITEADATSVAVLLKTLTVERGNRLMKAIPPAVLKDAAGLMDKSIDSPDQVIASIITKIEQVASTVTERAQAQRRLILRLVKTVSVADEGMVYDLVPPEDWDLKRQIMQTKLFLKDMAYVPGKVIGQAFGGLPLAKRTEVMLMADAALRAAIQSTLPSGTKKAEMLQTEIDQTQKNAKKMAEINTRKDAIIESLLTAVRKIVSSDRNVVDEIILSQAKALGLQPPEGVNAQGEERKAS